METRREAIVLLGPTGSGKTPLGDMLAARGLAGRRCVHLDFGANLRQCVARGQADEIVSRADLQSLRRVLETGALLEDKDFPLAERILRSFLRRGRVDGSTWVALNGLPRHVGQAELLARTLHVLSVVCLDCTPETVLARIESDTGGDRAGRTDDDLAAIARKLAIFSERTAPLVEYYQTRGARVRRLPITVATTAGQAWELFQRICVETVRLNR